jgi:hypothetical protein
MRKLPSSLFWEQVLHLVGWKSIDRRRDRFAEEAKAAGKKVKSGGSDPTFDGFQPPKVLLGRSRPSRKKRDRVLAACKLEPMKVRMRVLLNGSTGRRTKCPF